MKKLAVIITHPIQYYAPIFHLITERRNIHLKVFYTWEQSKEKVWDEKFGKEIKWDIPLLEGYEHTFVKNRSKSPGSGRFKGVINPTLIHEIIEWKADAVLIFGWNHHSHFKSMRFFKGKIPVYFRGDSTIIDSLPPIKKFARFLFLNFVYKFIDHAFFVGTNNKTYYKKYGLKEKQLIFAPHAIDNNRFNTPLYVSKSNELRARLGISSEDLIFLFAGKFEEIKNPMILMEAARFFPEFKFLFVGNGILEKEMKMLAGKNVFFLPFQNQSQMPVIYNLCNVLILPSTGRGETWGLVVNEAMACGKAVLVSDRVGCAVDLVKNNDNGYIFDSENVDDLKRKIILISKKHVEFGFRSKEIIKDWSFEKIAFAIENTLLSL